LFLVRNEKALEGYIGYGFDGFPMGGGGVGGESFDENNEKEMLEEE
jgi:hypothetical protein